MKNQAFAGKALLALLCGTALSVPAFAQDASEPQTETQAETPQGGEIIVTATRRDTALQSTPAAVTALGERELEARSLETVEDIGLLDTSLQVSFYQSEAQVFVRGIGTPITIGGTDSATAIYRDGVFLSRAAASIPGFFDVGQVEVLKGPQGTLYGRNATAGSILITSKKPTDELTGEFNALLGNYDRYELYGALSGPITDSVLFRVAAQRNKRDGFAKAIRPSADPSSPVTSEIENKDEWFFRGALEFRASEDLTVTLAGDYYKADDAANVFYLVSPTFFDTGPTLNPGINGLFIRNARTGRTSQFRTRDNYFSDAPFINKPEIWGVSANIEWALGDYTLRSTTGYRQTKPYNQAEFDFSDVFESTQFRAEDQDQFTQELQISSPKDGRFFWIAGGSYFREKNKLRNEYLVRSVPELFGLLGVPTLPIQPCCTFILNGNLDTTAFSLFVDTTFELTDRLTVHAGIRYSNELRGGENLLDTAGVDRATLGAALGLDAAGVANFLFANGLANQAVFDDTRFTAFTPSFGIDYQVNDDVFLYAKVTRGFKSGGFNIGSLQNTPFDQEFVWSYEAGLRSDLFDRLLRLNLTAFRYDYSDLQVQTVENNSIRVENSSNAKIFGIEGQFVLKPASGVTIDGAITYLDSEYQGYTTVDPARPALGVLDLSGNTLQKAPKVQFSLGAEVVVPLGQSGDLTLRGDWSHQSKIFLSQFNLDEFAQGSYDWLKARATYRPTSGGWSLSAFIDNITDELVVTNAVYNGAVVAQFGIGNFAPPRTYGLEFSYKF